MKWNHISAGMGYEYINSIAINSQDNIYVAGSLGSPLYFEEDTIIPSGGVDLLIVAYDTLGNHLWATSAGGGGVDQARGLEFDSQDNLYVLGKTSSSSLEFGNLSYSIEEPSILLAKLAPNNMGLSDLPAESALVDIFPNPNTGAFSIRSEQNLEQLEIYNLLGEKVFEKYFSKPTKQQEIETSLITGVYFVLIKTVDGNYTAQKMIVE